MYDLLPPKFSLLQLNATGLYKCKLGRIPLFLFLNEDRFSLGNSVSLISVLCLVQISFWSRSSVKIEYWVAYNFCISFSLLKNFSIAAVLLQFVGYGFKVMKTKIIWVLKILKTEKGCSGWYCCRWVSLYKLDGIQGWNNEIETIVSFLKHIQTLDRNGEFLDKMRQWIS